MALDLRYKLVFALYLWHFYTDFLQTLHESWYWDGESWDCRWINFDKYIQSYGPWFTLEIVFCSLSLAFLYRFSSNFAWESILGRSVLELQMSKFQQICTELWPLIYVRNWFSLSIFFYDGQQIISEFITQICLGMSIRYSLQSYSNNFSWRGIMLACSAFICSKT